jgi:osmotically-inducible protein OsmY
MFHSRPHSFTHALIAGGLLSLAVPVAGAQAASPAAISAQQTQPAPDSEIAAKIRKAIADDKALAAYAQTLKVVVSDGLVALKGSVKSEADKKAIGQKADAIAGEKNVMNNLVVAAEN